MLLAYGIKKQAKIITLLAVVTLSVPTGLLSWGFRKWHNQWVSVHFSEWSIVVLSNNSLPQNTPYCIYIFKIKCKVHHASSETPTALFHHIQKVKPRQQPGTHYSTGSHSLIEIMETLALSLFLQMRTSVHALHGMFLVNFLLASVGWRQLPVHYWTLIKNKIIKKKEENLNK